MKMSDLFPLTESVPLNHNICETEQTLMFLNIWDTRNNFPFRNTLMC